MDFVTMDDKTLKEISELMVEIREYLQCVVDQSMSRNNAEALASELIDRMDDLVGKPTL